MKINELRIGNYIQDKDGNIDEVRALAAVRGSSEKINDIPYEGYFQPIPLTEEWLIKFGLVKNPDTSYDIVRYDIDEYQTVKLYSCGGASVAQEGMDAAEANYVHQLQNYHFLVIGKELTVKLT